MENCIACLLDCVFYNSFGLWKSGSDQIDFLEWEKEVKNQEAEIDRTLWDGIMILASGFEKTFSICLVVEAVSWEKQIYRYFNLISASIYIT